MQTLIIGNGGREHALAWKISLDPKISKIYIAPGNAGTALENKCENLDIDPLNFPALIAFAKQNKIALTIIGPEAPLAAGIVDAFNQENLPCFGPNKAAAHLEASKAFSKDFMRRHAIPTARYANFTDATLAKQYIAQQNLPIVIKADGLASGKGVVIAHSLTEAYAAVDAMLTTKKFGNAGYKIVVEEFLQGEEVSFMVITDGTHILPLATSQDHKARDNGDKGPNTGGMGAFSPAPIVNAALQDKIMTQVILPTVQGMQADGNNYLGFLYAGLMITPSGELKVLEYNCRLGDPETQVIMLRLQSYLIDICQAALNNKLKDVSIESDKRPALNVVLAAGGYPEAYNSGDCINGLNDINDPNIKIFHAGTALKDNKTITNGGRVLSVCAIADSFKEAQAKAYNAIQHIHWKNMYYRTDIGNKVHK